MKHSPPPSAASAKLAATARSSLFAARLSPALLAAGLVSLLVLLLGLWNLGGPAMWWDEGWTLSVARHWVEQGHYGRLRSGEPVSAGLAASFPVVAGVAAGMRLFGVGLWQGRLFGVLCTALALWLLAALSRRLYDGRVALASLAVALLLTMHPQIHPLLQGRQVLAEMPMMAFLLAGFLLLALALPQRLWLMLPAMVCLGLAWIAKAQTAPFLIVALLLPALLALLLRQWRIVAFFQLALLGSYLAMRSASWGFGIYVQGQALTPEPTTGLLEVVALVWKPHNRLLALSNALSFGLPTLLGLAYGCRVLWNDRRLAFAADGQWYMRLALLALSGSWLAWFALLSVGVPRYLAPPVCLAAIFVAVLLRDISGGFDLRGSIERLGGLLTLRRVNRSSMAAMLLAILFIGPLTLTTLAFQRYYFETERSAQRVTAYFNALPADKVLIETYESELHFLLKQAYHYPPDQIHVELNRRSLLHESVAIDYDALSADPDYLVIGQFAQGNQLYQPLIESGAFRLIASDQAYMIYERVP